MPKLTDETLMLYADGLLDPPDRDHVEELLADDEEMRARLNVFHLTGRQLAALLQHHVDAPVPKRLRDALMEEKPEWSGAGGARRLSRFPNFRLPKLCVTGIQALQPALAAGLAMIAGIGLGWLLRGEAANNAVPLGDLVQMEGNRLFAVGALQRTLETVPSGRKSTLTLSGNREIDLGVKMTFRNETRDYCREYQITMPSTERYVGVACRVGRQWAVEIHAITAPSFSASDRTVPASGGDSLAMDAAVGALVFGDPLTGEEERTVIRDRWKTTNGDS